jgi:HlyD family secretion protein
VLQQKAEVIADVAPDLVFPGVVTHILHQADVQKNTLEVKVKVENPDPLLRPEILARVKFLARDTDGNETATAMAMYAPEEAVAGDNLWVAGDFDGTYALAESRTITASGKDEDGWIRIDQGIREGDLVILSPPEALRSGARLKVTLKN